MDKTTELEEFLLWADRMGHWMVRKRHEYFVQYKEALEKQKLVAISKASGSTEEE
jgi:hypothetical protein